MLIALAAMALVAIRKHDCFVNPQLWAEDGGLFLIEAELHGWSVLFKPYEGYLHFIPRTVAAIGASLPMLVVPTFYTIAAWLGTGLVAWIIQSPRLRVPGGWIAAIAIGAVPHTGEVYLTICNFQWIAAIGLFALAIMDDATTPGERFGDVLLLTATSLTGPFVLLALPFFLWRLAQRRTVWSLVLAVVAIAGATAQLPSLLARPVNPSPPPWDLVHFAAVAGRRWWVVLFGGGMQVPSSLSILLAIILPALLGIALWKRLPRRSGAGQLLLLALIVLAAIACKARADTWSYDDLANGDRYFFIPKLLAIWLVGALAVMNRGWPRFALAAALLLALLSNATEFIYPAAPPQHWKTYAASIERGQPTMVDILPAGFRFWHPGRHPR